jgi:hypothetical protein
MIFYIICAVVSVIVGVFVLNILSDDSDIDYRG